MKFTLFGVKFNTLYVILIALLILVIAYFSLKAAKEGFFGFNSNAKYALSLVANEYPDLPSDQEVDKALGSKYPPQFKPALKNAMYAIHQTTYGVPYLTKKGMDAATNVIPKLTPERQRELSNIIGPLPGQRQGMDGEVEAEYSTEEADQTASPGFGDEDYTSPAKGNAKIINVDSEGFSNIDLGMNNQKMKLCVGVLQRVDEQLASIIDKILALKGETSNGSMPCGEALGELVGIEKFDADFNYLKECVKTARPGILKLSQDLSSFPELQVIVDQCVEYVDTVMMYLTNFRNEFTKAAVCPDPPAKDTSAGNAPVGAASSAASATPLASQNQTAVTNSCKAANIVNTSMPANTSQAVPCDNYNHYNKSSVPPFFYGPGGAIAKVATTMGGRYNIITTDNDGVSKVYTERKQRGVLSRPRTPSPDNSTYYNNSGPQRTRAVFYTNRNGGRSIKVVYGDGTFDIYNENMVVEGHTNMQPANTRPVTTMEVIDIDDSNGNVEEVYTNVDTSPYQSSLPAGIPRSQIPPGQDDLYILKSEVVPPVCPACPPQIMKCKGDDNKKPPPCPPCARCPEPSFECKKVPNYGSGNMGANYNNFDGAFGRMMTPDGNPVSLPQPPLNNYTTYGT